MKRANGPHGDRGGVQHRSKSTPPATPAPTQASGDSGASRHYASASNANKAGNANNAGKANNADKASNAGNANNAGNAYFWRRLFPAALLVIALCATGRIYWEKLFAAFGAYPSDVWYIYHNYGYFLVHQAHFNIEYPAPMLVLFKILSNIAAWFPGQVEDQYGGMIYPYINWIAVNSVFLGLCGLVSVWFAYHLCVRYFKLPPSRVLWGFVLTPCFLFFSIYNYDMVTVLCSLAALWLYLEDDYAGASAVCGLGFAFKVYPGLMFPLIWLCLPWVRRWKALGAFALPWALLNIPLMVSDFGCWLYPYTWQMNFDNTEEETGRLGYTLYGLIGKLPALIIMMAIMAVVLWLVWKKRPADFRHNVLWLGRSTLVLFACFMLLKNVFSPQYLIWLTPLLALCGGYPFWGLYTLVELVSGIEVTCLFRLKDHLPEFIVCGRALRDLATIWVMWYMTRKLCQSSVQAGQSNDRASQDNGKATLRPSKANQKSSQGKSGKRKR